MTYQCAYHECGRLATSFYEINNRNLWIGSGNYFARCEEHSQGSELIHDYIRQMTREEFIVAEIMSK
jgi:hypothetical protein